MEVLNGRSEININIKCVILMYMGDNWILNYPSIKHRIHRAGSLVMKIIIRKRSVVLTCNSEIQVHIFQEHSELPFPTPGLCNWVFAQGWSTAPSLCELVPDWEERVWGLSRVSFHFFLILYPMATWYATEQERVCGLLGYQNFCQSKKKKSFTKSHHLFTPYFRYSVNLCWMYQVPFRRDYGLVVTTILGSGLRITPTLEFESISQQNQEVSLKLLHSVFSSDWAPHRTALLKSVSDRRSASSRFGLQWCNVCVLGDWVLGFNLGVVNSYLVTMSVTEGWTGGDRFWICGMKKWFLSQYC